MKTINFSELRVGEKFVVGSGDTVYMKIEETARGNAVALNDFQGYLFRLSETRRVVRCKATITVIKED